MIGTEQDQGIESDNTKNHTETQDESTCTLQATAISEISPEVADEWILPHRVRDSQIGQHVGSVVPHVLG